MTPALNDTLKALCETRTFAAGEYLRRQGTFAKDMLFILEGEVQVDLSPHDETDDTLTIGRNAPIGEIGFLSGRPANADVVALTAVTALVITQNSLLALETRDPEGAVTFARHLARTVVSRAAQNDALLPDKPAKAATGMEIIRCVDTEALRRAQRLRYEVYCLELGRTSPYADTVSGTIADDLDKKGVTFLGARNDADIGTVRVNLASDGELGILENLYGMSASEHYPARTAIVTKYAIRENFRGGTTYMRLFAAIATYLESAGMEEVFMDCVPKLAIFYGKMGFVPSEAEFLHYENGLSVPMRLEFSSYRKRLSIDAKTGRAKLR